MDLVVAAVDTIVQETVAAEIAAVTDITAGIAADTSALCDEHISSIAHMPRPYN